jgi:hypothetical protein
MAHFEKIHSHQLRELRRMMVYFVGLLLVAAVLIFGLTTAL